MSQPRPVTDDKAPARQRGKGEVVLDETAISMGRTLGPAVVGPSSDTLYALLDESGKPLETPGAAKLNSDGAEMLEVWGRFAKLYANWNNKYSTVKLNLRFRQWGKEKCKVVV